MEISMKKLVYEPLTDFLARHPEEKITISFSKIEDVLGRKLPPTAYGNEAWWTNNPAGHSQAKAWLAAGFRAEPVDITSKLVVFKRVQPKLSVAGMAEEPREFKPAETDAEKKPRRHPAFGALKGLLWIEPGYDLTQPTWDDEMEEAFDKKWDALLK
jgi:hypothetical protein